VPRYAEAGKSRPAFSLRCSTCGSQLYPFEMRRIGNRETYYEWFQRRYELCEKRQSATPAIPSYVAFCDWEE
jgi:hypothetical protein